MKKISVIIPFYSNVQWLHEALESVFSQTYENLEVILINDGSKEDISSILHRYGHKIVYLYQDNAGPAAARNLGIHHATGEYIAFEDSDDVWLPDKLLVQIAFMERVNAVWSHTGFVYWWPEKNKERLVDSSLDYCDIYQQRFISTKIATPSVVIRKDILDSNPDLRFPINYRNGEDDKLYTQIARLYPIALVQHPYVKVRMRGNNSQGRVFDRFALRVNQYHEIKSLELPRMTKFIHWIYYMYSFVLKPSDNKFMILIAKILWGVPYVIERVYVRYLASRVQKDEKYILRV